MAEKNIKALEAQRAYQREWRKNNREKVKEYNERYWARRVAKEECSKGEAE